MENDTAPDLLAEYRDLAALCDTLTPAQWNAPSAFYGWTPWDEIAHLCYFDEAALQSVNDPERFSVEAKALSARILGGEEFSTIHHQTYGHLDGAALLDHHRRSGVRQAGPGQVRQAPLPPLAHRG